MRPSNVSIGKLATLEVLLPPLGTQQRIGSEIEKQFSRLDEAVISLKRAQADLKRYKAAVLKAAVEGKLTEQWRKEHPVRDVDVEAASRRFKRSQRQDAAATQDAATIEPASELLKRILAERREKWEEAELAKMKAKGRIPKDDKWKAKYKEPTAPDTSNLPELPQGWVWCMSDAVFTFITSGSRGWAKFYSESGPIFLRIGNLNHEDIRLDMRELQHVSPPRSTEGQRTLVRLRDLLISITADIGMVAVAPSEIGEAYINQHLALARPVFAINANYLGYYLASSHGGWRWLKLLQRGATKQGLGLDDIASVPVPLPPLSEQEAIVAEIDRRISLAEEMHLVFTANLQRATHLRQTVLAAAFSKAAISFR